MTNEITRTHNRPVPRVPVYRTERLYSRQGLWELFSREWGPHRVTLADVNNFTAGIAPVAHAPFPDMPDIEERDRENHNVRLSLINKHEEQREATRKARQLFDPAGLGAFVPANDYPSLGDDDATYARKQNRISRMRTDDLDNEEN